MWRICVNFKPTVEQRFSVQAIGNVVHHFQGSPMHSSSGFDVAVLQIQTHPDGRHMTPFHTRIGRLEYNVMLCGHRIEPAELSLQVNYGFLGDLMGAR